MILTDLPLEIIAIIFSKIPVDEFEYNWFHICKKIKKAILYRFSPVPQSIIKSLCTNRNYTLFSKQDLYGEKDDKFIETFEYHRKIIELVDARKKVPDNILKKVNKYRQLCYSDFKSYTNKQLEQAIVLLTTIKDFSDDELLDLLIKYGKSSINIYKAFNKIGYYRQKIAAIWVGHWLKELGPKIKDLMEKGKHIGNFSGQHNFELLPYLTSNSAGYINPVSSILLSIGTKYHVLETSDYKRDDSIPDDYDDLFSSIVKN